MARQLDRAVRPEISAEAFLRTEDPEDVRSELVDGRLVRESRPGARHGSVQAQVAAALLAHVGESGAGTVTTESGFVLRRDPDTVRGPDVAFFSRERLASPPPAAFPEVAPDLAVEILSPSDSAASLAEKVADYLDAGVRLVWVIDPERGTGASYRAGGAFQHVPSGGTMNAGEVLPGSKLRLEEVLAWSGDGGEPARCFAGDVCFPPLSRDLLQDAHRSCSLRKHR